MRHYERGKSLVSLQAQLASDKCLVICTYVCVWLCVCMCTCACVCLLKLYAVQRLTAAEITWALNQLRSPSSAPPCQHTTPPATLLLRCCCTVAAISDAIYNGISHREVFAYFNAKCGPQKKQQHTHIQTYTHIQHSSHCASERKRERESFLCAGPTCCRSLPGHGHCQGCQQQLVFSCCWRQGCHGKLVKRCRCVCLCC